MNLKTMFLPGQNDPSQFCQSGLGRTQNRHRQDRKSNPTQVPEQGTVITFGEAHLLFNVILIPFCCL